MMTTKQEVIIITTIVLVFAIAGWVGYQSLPSKQDMEQDMKERQQRNYNNHRQEGYNAQKAGVPANGNPHLKYPRDAKAWLDGWMEANTEKK